jgi:hypothetical protein
MRKKRERVYTMICPSCSGSKLPIQLFCLTCWMKMSLKTQQELLRKAEYEEEA